MARWVTVSAVSTPAWNPGPDLDGVTIGEHDDLGLTHSDAAPVFDLDIGRVACVICFDLNFDQLRERYAKARPDLVQFSSMFHGSFLQTQWSPPAPTTSTT